MNKVYGKTDSLRPIPRWRGERYLARQLGGFIALSIVHSMKSIGKGGGNQELNGQEHDKRGGITREGAGRYGFSAADLPGC
ncbi:MAG: hypothetical protein K0A99_08440 [Desulfoarculaceae bacterium]|nr:hypothetical protein [Desulfoarculaceae bacterium]